MYIYNKSYLYTLEVVTCHNHLHGQILISILTTEVFTVQPNNSTNAYERKTGSQTLYVIKYEVALVIKSFDLQAGFPDDYGHDGISATAGYFDCLASDWKVFG